MSSWDLFVDGFPHSTPEGYARGCRGSSCPGVQEFGWSCTFALQQSRGDYHWSKWFREGRSPAEIVELRRAYEEPVVATPQPVPPVKPVEVVSVVDSREPVRPVAKSKPSAEPKHGAWAYGRGCHCEVCVAGHDEWLERRVAKRRARLVDGVAPVARHGLGTARGWGCGCRKCVRALELEHRRQNPVQRREYKRLTSEQVSRARALRRQDVSWRDIAAQLGVKHSTVQKAVARAEAAS